MRTEREYLSLLERCQRAELAVTRLQIEQLPVDQRLAERSLEFPVHDPWRPSIVMGQLFAAIESVESPVTLLGLFATFPNYQRKIVSQAVSRLIYEGYLEEQRHGRGRTKTLRVVKPFDPSLPYESSSAVSS